MIRLGSSEVAILTWLANQEHGTAAEIGHACGIAMISVRGRLSNLERNGLVTGEFNKALGAVRRYAITDKGRQEVERC